MTQYCSLAQPRLDGDHPPERRVAGRRLVCGWSVTCRSVMQSQASAVWPALIEDISPGGIGLVIGRRFEKDTVLVVECPTADCLTQLVLARVVRMRPCGSGSWRIGCQLASPLDPQELEHSLVPPSRRAVAA